VGQDGEKTCRLIEMFVHLIRFAQDPYIKLTLHDGEFDKGGHHRGESVRTTTKDNAGGTCSFGESFSLNKPENMDVMRVELYDSNTAAADELLGRQLHI